jgi:hypothetical protein
MYRNTVFICKIDDDSSLNSEEPCVEYENQAYQCLEYQGQHLVEYEKEEEEQLQLLRENETSFFNLESLVLFGIRAVALIGGIV